MIKAAVIISYAALVLLIVAPILFYSGKIPLEQSKLLMLSATIAWFASAVFWMGKEKENTQ